MRSDGSTFLDRFSKKTVENLLFAGMAVVLVAAACVHVFIRPPQNSVDLFTALNPDGSMEGQVRLSFVWRGPTPMLEFTDNTSLSLVENRWTDEAGDVLDVKTEPREKGGYLMHVRFPEPVFPKERVALKATFRTLESGVRKEGEDYVFSNYPDPGPFGNRPFALTSTVTLPKGAKVVSTKPETEWRCVVDERDVLHFKWTAKPGSRPELRVKYSLPKA